MRFRGVQSYINLRNLHSVQNINGFLKELGVASEESVVISHYGKFKYASIYVPPIVNNHPAFDSAFPDSSLESLNRNDPIGVCKRRHVPFADATSHQGRQSRL